MKRVHFTGAISQKIGRLEPAHRGTLFLDAVGDPLELQPKLLRALQEITIQSTGSREQDHMQAFGICRTMESGCC